VCSWVISGALWACWEELTEQSDWVTCTVGKLDSPREVCLFCIHPPELAEELVMVRMQKEATMKENSIGWDVSENG